jgi:hypothetical protein
MFPQVIIRKVSLEYELHQQNKYLLQVYHMLRLPNDLWY